jgi:hypothetical protein
MNNAGCTEFKTPPFCFVLMMALVAAVLAVPISRTLYETRKIPII